MIRLSFLICTLAAAAIAFSQEAGLNALHQRLGAVKQSIAQNQARLKQYTWTETTEISLKGEEKKRTQADCLYGPDGKVQKTPVGNPAPPASRRGIKGKIVANKIEDMKDYMDRVGSLVQRYVPPNPQSLQEVFEKGNAQLSSGGVLVFHDYFKPGDNLTITFNPGTKRVVSFAVATYLDEPKDVVTLDAHFSSLPDGTNFLEESVLNATAKQIQIKKTNSGYRKLAG
jgi:hypothetical protein